MKPDEHHQQPRHRLRSRALLVLVLLAGLLGMHAMGPASAVAGQHQAPGYAMPAHQMGGSAMPVAGMPTGEPTAGPGPGGSAPGTVVIPVPHAGCDHFVPASDRHTRHADAACASASVSGTPSLAAPASAPYGLAASGPLPAVVQGTPAAGGRAPPSLAELQLLRI